MVSDLELLDAIKARRSARESRAWANGKCL